MNKTKELCVCVRAHESTEVRVWVCELVFDAVSLVSSWNQYSSVSGQPANITPAYRSPMSVMWWQQLYAQQYYMH